MIQDRFRLVIMRNILLSGVLVAVIILTGCGGGGDHDLFEEHYSTPPPVPQVRGAITGTLYFSQESSGVQPASSGYYHPEKLTEEEAEFVPGEILVRYRDDSELSTVRSLQTFPGLDEVRRLPGGAHVLRLSAEAHLPAPRSLASSSASAGLRAQTLELCRLLRQDPRVLYAEPNYRRRSLERLPNDRRYPEQWSYSLIRLPRAWSITTGSEEVVVAVIDTAIAPHPDLADRLLPGMSFVSAADHDPTGAGKNHGTHVAGIIAAATDNFEGVAGVTWQSKILPLQALDSGGGATDEDLSQAIRYAAGLPNASGEIPARRADIINLSMGGPGEGHTLHEAIIAAREEGVFIVAAAGNGGSSTKYYPAAYEGVISVAAVRSDGYRASYSNSGSTIDLAAPGGTESDGILSTGFSGEGADDYTFLDGTSMATAHVSGVLALMQALAPGLGHGDVQHFLAGSHPDLPGLRITRRSSLGRDDFYGYGLIDAYKGVQAARLMEEIFHILILDQESGEIVAEAQTSSAKGFLYRIQDIPAGRYLIVAGTTRGEDGLICEIKDLCGIYPEPVDLTDPGEKELQIGLELERDPPLGYSDLLLIVNEL